MLRPLEEVCCVAAHALDLRARQLDEEQSPYGLDALDERALCDVLRAGFADAGFGVVAEAPYPSAHSKARRSEGERCDIVLTPSPARPLAADPRAGPLFAASGVPAAEAIWLEVKVAMQFALTDGVAGPSRRYTTQLLRETTADIRKLACEEGLGLAAALLIHCTASLDIAQHDLNALVERCLRRRLPIDSPIVERRPLTDRLGNTLLSVAALRVKPG
ncbi:MAG: hypothetical protein D6824_05545 [Planctomycetota bacterium]|nr:MAG: hypothetical protein D6824_05545 [Planctomycetota bacterium]